MAVVGALGGSTVFKPADSTPVPPPAGSAQVWVDLNGGTCTRQSPAGDYSDVGACASLDAAEAIAQPGDTVRVVGGVYPQQNVFGTADTTDKADVTFMPADGSSVTFSGKNELRDVDDLILEGFLYTGDDALVLDESRRIIIRKNEFQGPGNIISNAAITLSNSGLGTDGSAGGSDDVLIEDNWIDRNGGGIGIDLISGAVGDLTVRGNYITRPHEDHLHYGTTQSVDATQPWIVEDNVLHDAEPCCGSHSDAMQIIVTDAPFVIRRNVFDQFQHGIVVTGTINAGPLITFENNYMVGNGAGTAWNGGSPCQAGIMRNNTWRGTNSSWDLACAAIANRTGNVVMETSTFTDGDYNVSNNSVTGANSVNSTDAAVFANTGSTSVANVYPPRVLAQWGSRLTSDTILDPRLKSGTSPALGRSHPTNVPTDDVLSCVRGGDPDGGAYEEGC